MRCDWSRTVQSGATNCCKRSYQTPSLSCGMGCGHARLCCQLPKLANVIGCQIWQVLSIAKFGKFCRLPKLASIISCQNWQMLSFSKIGKCYQLPKLANFEDTKVAKIGKYHQLSNLTNVVGCQNWRLNIPAVRPTTAPATATQLIESTSLN